MNLEVSIPIIATCVVALSNIVLVVLTFKYVKATNHMVKEMKISREPSVYLDFEFPSFNSHYLIIQNFGDSAAFDIKVSFDDNLQWRKCLLEKVSIFDDGISYLIPGRKLIFRAGVLDWEKSKKQGGTITFEIKFKNEVGDQFQRIFTFDATQHSGVQTRSYTDIGDKISNAVEKVRDEITDTHFKGIYNAMK